MVFFVIGIIIYFLVTFYAGYALNRIKQQKNVLYERNAPADAATENTAADNEAEADEVDTNAAYSICLNKAYKEYKVKYDEACSKYVMDGVCYVSREKQYELDGIYMHEKDLCEKLRE